MAGHIWRGAERSRRDAGIMNILDFLTADHERILKELHGLKHHLHDSDAMGRLKKFGIHFALHQSIEEDILMESVGPRLASSEGAEAVAMNGDSDQRFDREFERFLDVLNGRSVSECRAAFLAFSDFVTARMKEKEKVLFPRIRESVDHEMLNALGLRAEQYYYSMDKSRDAIARGESA